MNRYKKFYFIIIISIAIVWLYSGNHSLQITHYNYSSKKLCNLTDEITIVQISDLHNAEFGENQMLLIDKIKKQNPDIIVITGDLIDSYHPDINNAVNLISKAVAIAPVYYVTGNHEANAEDSYSELRKELTKYGVNILDNQSEKITLEKQNVYIMGVTDPSFSERSLYESNKTIIYDAIETTKPATDDFIILLSHRPELFDVYTSEKIDLVLTGHAHGGQFRIPFLGGLVAPDQGFLPKYDAGIFVEGTTGMIVNRGLGNSIIPIRINNRPEIVVVHLVKEISSP